MESKTRRVNGFEVLASFEPKLTCGSAAEVTTPSTRSTERDVRAHVPGVFLGAAA